MDFAMFLGENKILRDYSFFILLGYNYTTHLAGVKESLLVEYSLPFEQIKFIENSRD
jgi:hypothetical protein